MLRRNPTDAERLLWDQLRADRRFAGQFKRQTPVGRHIPDFVSFPARIAIELVNPGETEVIVSDRAARQTWLQERGYRVIAMRAEDVTRDIAAELDRLEALLASGMPGRDNN
jgi:tRNA/rRNA methyltransferase